MQGAAAGGRSSIPVPVPAFCRVVGKWEREAQQSMALEGLALEGLDMSAISGRR